MKSIMEEASTVAKAIENAWNRAGQPQEFSVKILEHPKTSFFGLKTAKSAKIALIFDETKIKEQQPVKQARPVVLRPQQSSRADHQGERSQQPRRPQQHPERAPHENHPAPSQQGRPDNRRPQRNPRSERPTDRQDRPQQSPRPERSEPRPYEQRTSAPRHTQDENRETWTPEMVDAARDWLKETLVLMGKPDIRVEPYVSHNYLKLYLDRPVLEDSRQEETQLKSWGSLAMEAVREKANKPLRNLRIILEGKK